MNSKVLVRLVDGIIIGSLFIKTFMKTILIFAAVAGVAIVAAYYLLMEDDRYLDDLSLPE